MQSEEALNTLIPELAMSLGIHKSIYNQEGARIITHMPIAYYPYAISGKTFSSMISLHEKWQQLLVKVASDSELMQRISAAISKNDPFMRRICQLYQKTLKQSNNIKVACTRIDYMGDEKPKLVEFNLMSVGLNGISDKVQELGGIVNTTKLKNAFYPQFRNQENLCEHLLRAMQLSSNSDGIVVMVVHHHEFNFGDQNAFKLEMARKGRYVISLTMDQLIKDMVYDQEENQCFYGKNKISAFYFRTGYTPEQLPTERHWVLKEKIQLSNAIKLPSVDMLIVNSKRMQAELAKKQVLAKYLSPEDVKKIVEVSGQIYEFDNLSKTNLPALIEKMRVSQYVLKPNREGGGNNFFAQKAYLKLLELEENYEELQNYIVMKAIESEKNENAFIYDFQRENIPETTAQVSTFGCFVYQGDTVLSNKYGGFLVRLKKADEKEGGIALNKSVIASICVVPSAQQ